MTNPLLGWFVLVDEDDLGFVLTICVLASSVVLTVIRVDFDVYPL